MRLTWRARLARCQRSGHLVAVSLPNLLGLFDELAVSGRIPSDASGGLARWQEPSFLPQVQKTLAALVTALFLPFPELSPRIATSDLVPPVFTMITAAQTVALI